MKYILISLGVVLLIIFGIVIFNRGGSPRNTATPAKVLKLTDYKDNTGAAVEYEIQGAINALENHRSIQIIVSPTTRTINIYRGYQGEVLSTKTYTNDGSSYTQFLAALTRAGFTKERKLAKDISSEAVCPTNTRTYYKIVEGANNVMDTWSASCTSGSFAGNTSLTSTLFRGQIPDYTKMTQNVVLSMGSN